MMRLLIKKIKILNEKFKDSIKIVKLDLEREEDIEIAFSKIKEIAPNIDILVNNAGINQMSLFQMTTLKTFKSVF